MAKYLRVEEEDPRFKGPADRWKWRVLRDYYVNGAPRSPVAERVPPPPGHKWLEIIIAHKGEQVRRRMAITLETARNKKVVERYANQMRERVRIREGI